MSMLLTGLLAATLTWAPINPFPETEFSIERLYSFPIINGRSPSGPAMSPDGSQIVFGWNRTGQRRLDPWIMDYPSGEVRQLFRSVDIAALPNQDDTRTQQQKIDEIVYDNGLGGFQWAPDGSEILAGPYKGRVWLFEPDGSNLRPIFDTAEGISSARFSPDGRFISFQRGANLFRYDRQTRDVKQLTFLTRSQTAISSYAWAPDGQNIAVVWDDSSVIGSHVMMDFTKDRAEVVGIRRLWQGEQGINVQVGIVPADGGLIKFVEGLPRYIWVVGMDWSPDGRYLALGWIRNDFQEYTISQIQPREGTPRRLDIYRETPPKNYIPDFRKLFWSQDSRHLFFTTDIHEGEFGYRSLYKMDPFGRDVTAVYREDHDIAAAGRPRDSDDLILVTLARSPLMSEVVVQKPDGDRQVYAPVEGMSTPQQFDDAGLPLFSFDGSRIATMASMPQLSAELYGLEPDLGRLTRSQLPEFDKIQWAEHREVTFEGPDGATIHGLLIVPPNYDRSRPGAAVISNMYANSAKMSWGGYFENFAANHLNIVMLKVDFRASWGYGGEFNSGYFQSMGLIDSEEAVKAKEFLVREGYADPDRVGVWGWSYGGYLTCMIQLTQPGEFKAGVAVNSVTDWKTYNEWYTTRRLGFLRDNREIFEKTSPITYADQLQTDLFLVHGMLDDNVLFQDSARLMQRMIEAGIYFDQAVYPRDDHGIGRVESRPHVFRSILQYLFDKL